MTSVPCRSVVLGIAIAIALGGTTACVDEASDRPAEDAEGVHDAADAAQDAPNDADAAPEVTPPDAEPSDADAPDADAPDAAPQDTDAPDTDADVERDTADAADTADTADATPADATETDVADVSFDVVPPWDGEVPDTGPIPDELRLRRIEVGAISAHQVTTPGVSERGAGYGYGLVPLDADGDGDLDLFVGTIPNSDRAACVYENVSLAERPYFRERADWCAPVGFVATGGTAVDMDGDGRHELVVAGGTQFYAVSLAPWWSAERLAEPTARCSAGALVPVDLDADGTLELVSSCTVGFTEGPRIPSVAGNVWEHDASEGWRSSERLASPVVANALGIGVLDVDADGLLDLVTVVDTFGTPDRYDPNATPGAVLRRCAPGTECAFERVPLAEGAPAWGSFMGWTVVRINGAERWVMSDIGPFGAFAWRDGESRSDELALDPAPFGNAAGSYAFSWGLITEDWDDDGDDDIFASFGPFAAVASASATVLSDSVFLQDETGAFAASGRPFELESHDAFRDPVFGNPRASRAAIRMDIDQDGRQELVIAAINGPPFVYQHTGAVPRCTLRPQPRYAVTWGAGYRERSPDGAWHPVIVHGELHSSEGPWPVMRRPAGELQFPSGAVVPYACGERGVIDVEEPEWLRVFPGAAGVALSVDPDAWPEPVRTVDVALRNAAGEVQVVAASLADGLWSIADAADAAALLVAVNGRWVARWLPLPAEDG